MTAISLWLSVTFGLPEPPALPNIRHLDEQGMATLRFGRPGPARANDILAVYDEPSQTIMLRPGWSSGDIADLSVLVHEMVHHLQHHAGLVHACPQERERLAYEAQDRWLRLFGEDLESAFGLDRVMMMFMATCLPH